MVDEKSDRRIRELENHIIEWAGHKSSLVQGRPSHVKELGCADSILLKLLHQSQAAPLALIDLFERPDLPAAWLRAIVSRTNADKSGRILSNALQVPGKHCNEELVDLMSQLIDGPSNDRNTLKDAVHAWGSLIELRQPAIRVLAALIRDHRQDSDVSLQLQARRILQNHAKDHKWASDIVTRLGAEHVIHQ